MTPDANNQAAAGIGIGSGLPNEESSILMESPADRAADKLIVLNAVSVINPKNDGFGDMDDVDVSPLESRIFNWAVCPSENRSSPNARLGVRLISRL